VRTCHPWPLVPVRGPSVRRGSPRRETQPGCPREVVVALAAAAPPGTGSSSIRPGTVTKDFYGEKDAE